MSTVIETDGARRSEPRERLLQTAADLFYREGIHGVGVDRVLSEANVTRATMYRHFAGKEALVAAYLGLEDAGIRQAFAAAHEQLDGDPRALLAAIIEGIADDAERRHTRGCPFINAAAEYADPDSDVRRIVAAHRAWFRSELERDLAAAHVADPAAAAAALVLLRDAMFVGNALDGASVREGFTREARRVAGLD
ncbi:TetR/AcrR family transcriptional regulator [Agromyces protaetiae]|uniref:TetR/AcrR family transcriptional regulator n=1 Tax=Agromyces protaetiae TaxID=2509455 RepID=A0A4P6FPR9_9MICO|nr:TetR/AcrR family transcriptional regulator [Agromyces protaetiae]QAY72498.1 TetR/AcrR family transcriptional regulator [Agromyces protaetiae]